MLQAEQATSASEDRATIATLIGDQLLASRDLTGAAAAYERARTAAPGLAATEIGRARVAAAQGRLDEAVATLTALVERSPAPAPAAVLGELQQAAGHDDEAADSFALARAGTELLSGAGSTVDLEAALFAADHGDATEAVTLAEARLPHAPHRVHRRRAGLGADEGRSPCGGAAVRRRGAPPRARAHPHCTSMRPSPSPPPVIPHRPPPPCERPSNRRPGWSPPCGRRRLRWPTTWAYLSPRTGSHEAPDVARRRWRGRRRHGARGTRPPRGAHPLGNLTVNTYAGIVVRDDEITVDYVLDLAELPTVQAMQRIDLDGDGELGPAEAARYRGSECASLLDGLEVSLGGRPVPLTSGAGSVRLLPGQGGLETLRLECPLRRPRHARGRCRPRLHRRQLLRSHRLAGDHGGRRPHDRHRHRRARIVRVRPAARLSDRRSLPAAAGRGRREGRTGRAGPRSGGGVGCAGRSAGAAGPGRGSSDLVVPAHGGRSPAHRRPGGARPPRGPRARRPARHRPRARQDADGGVRGRPPGHHPAGGDDRPHRGRHAHGRRPGPRECDLGVAGRRPGPRAAVAHRGQRRAARRLRPGAAVPPGGPRTHRPQPPAPPRPARPRARRHSHEHGHDHDHGHDHEPRARPRPPPPRPRARPDHHHHHDDEPPPLARRGWC